MKYLLRSGNIEDYRRCSFIRFFLVLTHLWSSPDFLRISNLDEGTFKYEPVKSLKKKILFHFLFIVNLCQQLYAPLHGSLEPCSYSPGQTCEFSCDKGHILTGSTTRTCKSDGSWTGTPTQCNGNWSQILFLSSMMILGEQFWGCVLWCGCIFKRARHVSPCHQLQPLYCKCSILIATKTKQVCVSFQLSNLLFSD